MIWSPLASRIVVVGSTLDRLVKVNCEAVQPLTKLWTSVVDSTRDGPLSVPSIFTCERPDGQVRIEYSPDQKDLVLVFKLDNQSKSGGLDRT